MIEQASLVIGEGNWAVKSDSLLGYKINGGKYYPREMSVVRATTATRINEDGLVELVPYNLLTYSEEINNWGQERTSVITNATTAPNGTLTADKLITDSTPNTTHQAYNGAFTANVGTLVISGYFKKGEYNLVHLGTSASAQKAWFDLDTGVVGNYNAEILSASIENVGDGWYRCVAVVNNSSASIYVEFGPANVDGSRTILGTPSGGIFAWGIQYVEGSSALDYLPTTDRLDVARIDYSSGSGALLVEPQRTNLVYPSSDFSTIWSLLNSATVSTNQSIAPDGTLTADKITTTNSANALFNVNGSGTTAADYTVSLFIKPINNNSVGLGMTNDTTGEAFVLINLQTGAGTTTQQSGWSNASYKWEQYENGWYRISLTATKGASGNARFILKGNASSEYYIWGAQLEAGSYPTSYIPTQGSTVTRNADVISKTGIADLIGQTEGTLYAEFDAQLNVNGGEYYLSDGTNVIALQFPTSAPNTIRAVVYNGGGFPVVMDYTYSINGIYKVAFAYKTNDFALYVNGAQIATDNSGSVPACSSVQFVGMQKVASAALFKTRLTNAELATLTTI